MMNRNGFTLIETLIATLILAAGCGAVAFACFYGVQAGDRVQQQTSAIALLSEKLEEFKTRENLEPGRSTESLDGNTMRTWEITAESPQRVTVMIHRRQPGKNRPFREVARISTLIGKGF